ncbi:Fur family transcriptional regulator [Bifidobacterium panos]|uniref:Peptide ABC transporter substrate-binding protein n=1 Tax=Bifidobacterium panos TaxID=2675321 RepID=A0ABX1SZC9_9BIFI|nr:Fur family transcriptional regulator [Bifidobacterium sp. DSM 109963]NMN01763.1 peptide ABC transporter substrate-binding protein [Bifidobacterium sp. DSM 109963]
MSEHIERQTKQKNAIRAQLAACDDFISAQELHRQLKDLGSRIGLATVYRQLNALAEAGAVDTIRLDGQQLFRLCGDDVHHHHMVCTECGRTVEIESPGESWLRGLASKYGFAIASHTIEVFGLCPDCRKPKTHERQ